MLKKQMLKMIFVAIFGAVNNPAVSIVGDIKCQQVGRGTHPVLTGVGYPHPVSMGVPPCSPDGVPSIQSQQGYLHLVLTGVYLHCPDEGTRYSPLELDGVPPFGRIGVPLSGRMGVPPIRKDGVLPWALTHVVLCMVVLVSLNDICWHLKSHLGFQKNSLLLPIMLFQPPLGRSNYPHGVTNNSEYQLRAAGF